MKPIIGISSNLLEKTLSLSMDNIHAVSKFGGVPLVLPNLVEKEAMDAIAERIDGLLLTGGGDIDPALFGEEPHQRLGSICPERDTFEINIIKKMLEQNKPILAICRGCQILNIAVGGDMYQDIYTQHVKEVLQHNQNAPRWHASHFLQVKSGSLLNKIIQSEKCKVNSFHHQAVRKLGNGFEIGATSSDGIIEAFESKMHSFVLGVQWHPECMIEKNDEPSKRIFNAFVSACK